MKKFLSLVLALVMTMSLVTVSAGAKDFDDAADITYVEAVDVMSELKIVDGDTAGNFNPQNGLTRGAAAKIICNLILGPTTAAELNADTNPYPDVDKDSTFAGYIAYCQKEGIISGYADGTFKPANPLTGYAFMKMLLGALGYDPAVEGYTGANWSINVAKQAIGIGLNENLVDNFNGSDFVTREEAMLYAFNTMKATMVDYDTTITIGDITVAGSNERDVENNARVETIYNDGKMQFAEKYFTKLVLDQAAVDVFERPCNTWINGKEEIGTYVDYTEIIAEYTTAVTGKDLYDLVGGTAFEDYTFYGYVDGEADDFIDEIAKNNKADISVSGNGALMQVFVNNDAEYVVITIMNTYLAQATSDYNAKKDSVTFKIWDDVMTYTNGVVSGEDFDIADVKDEEFALVTYADGEIQSIAPVEIIADTEIQKFKAGKDGNITVDGEKYSYSLMAEYDADVLKAYTEVAGDTNLKDLTYNIFVDAYGYVIGVDLVEVPNNYLFVTGVDSDSSKLANKTWAANAIFMDGTSKVIDVKDGAATFTSAQYIVNKWYKYTVNNDGVYTLTKVEDAVDIYTNATKGDVAQKQTTEVNGDPTKELTIDSKHIALDAIAGMTYGNDASIYLLADLEVVDTNNVVIAGAEEVVTGVKNAAFDVYDATEAKAAAKKPAATSTSEGVYALYKDNGYVIAAVVVGESDTVSKNSAYVHTTAVSSESYDKATKTWTWTREVIIDGVEVTLTETNDTGVSVLKNTLGATAGNWFEIKYDADGFVKKATLLTDNAKDFVDTVAEAVARVKALEETVILDNAVSNHKYSLIGNTLYDATTGELGFLVADDVKVVLKQTNKNKSVTTYDVGVKTLENILENLNTTLDYNLDAIIVDGRATVVIIVDNTLDTDYVGPNGATTKVVATVRADNSITMNAPSGVTVTEDAGVSAAVEALDDLGYKVEDVTRTTSPVTYVFDTTKVVGGFVVSELFVWNTTTVVTEVVTELDEVAVPAASSGAAYFADKESGVYLNTEATAWYADAFGPFKTICNPEHLLFVYADNLAVGQPATLNIYDEDDDLVYTEDSTGSQAGYAWTICWSYKGVWPYTSSTSGTFTQGTAGTVTSLDQGVDYTFEVVNKADNDIVYVGGVFSIPTDATPVAP